MPTTEERRRRIRYLLLAVLLVLALAVFFVIRTAQDFAANIGNSTCRAVAASYTAQRDPAAMANAATITAVAARRGLPPRAATIAIATAMQESKLHNIDYGDRDSLGLFQQRPSMGWGTEAQIMDPVYATNAFLDQLVKLDGWQTGNINDLAQRVQKSGHPTAYAQHEQEARAMASTLSGQTPAGMGCRLTPLTAADQHLSPNSAAETLRTELGGLVRSATPGADSVTVTATSATTAWQAASWAVAHADELHVSQVTIGDRQWTRQRVEAGWSWQTATTRAASASTVVIR